MHDFSCTNPDDMNFALLANRVRYFKEDEVRIYQYFDEINTVPVPYKWKYKMDTIHLEDEDINANHL